MSWSARDEAETRLRDKLRLIGIAGGGMTLTGGLLITVWFGIALVMLGINGPDGLMPIWFGDITWPMIGLGGAAVCFGMVFWCIGYGLRECKPFLDWWVRV